MIQILSCKIVTEMILVRSIWIRGRFHCDEMMNEEILSDQIRRDEILQVQQPMDERLTVNDHKMEHVHDDRVERDDHEVVHDDLEVHDEQADDEVEVSLNDHEIKIRETMKTLK